jgi:3-hydroxyanthranilate 3,4-dioxygenase
MQRKNTFDTYKEAPARGPYDEMPMLELGIDPQVHLSRNATAQPFFLICESDSMIVQMAGEARIEFRQSPVKFFDAELGDFVYVPGGTPHRIVPKSPSIHLRYKAMLPGLEGVAWYQDGSDEEVSRVVWNCAEELPQEGYLKACQAFNADPKRRGGLPQIDLAPYRWAAVAGEIREAEAAETERAKRRNLPPFKTDTRGKRELTIKPPLADRVPLKTNCYVHARSAPAALSPLFPYFAPGCIVPGSVMTGTQGGLRGYFVHRNTVHEVNLGMGSDGAYPVPGVVRVGPMVHPVGEKPGQAAMPRGAGLIVITQRQAPPEEPQSESTIFFCEKCDTELLRRDYSAVEFPGELVGPADEEMIGLPTISQSAASANEFNQEEAARTCKKCGHANPPFPDASWGWEEYRRRTQIAVKVKRSLMAAAAAASN